MWLLYFSWKLSINIKTSSETGDIVYKDRDTKCSLVMKKWSNHHPTLTYFWNHSQQRTIRWRENAIEQDFPAKWRMLCPTSRRRPSPHTITSPVGAQPYYWTGVASVPYVCKQTSYRSHNLYLQKNSLFQNRFRLGASDSLCFVKTCVSIHLENQKTRH